MNLTRRLILLALATASVGHAEPPKQVPPMKYERLWTHSPFTPPPVNGPIVEGPGPVDDYVLLGVSPIPSGYRVTMLNKKKPTEDRVYVESNKSNGLGFSIVDVIRKDGDPLATVVRIKSGSATGMVGFDDKFLKLAAAAPPKNATSPPPPATGGAPGAPPDTKPASLKTPRPRVIQPPTPGQPAGQNPSNTGGPNNPSHGPGRATNEAPTSSRSPGRPPVVHHTR